MRWGRQIRDFVLFTARSWQPYNLLRAAQLIRLSQAQLLGKRCEVRRQFQPLAGNQNHRGSRSVRKARIVHGSGHEAGNPNGQSMAWRKLPISAVFPAIHDVSGVAANILSGTGLAVASSTSRLRMPENTTSRETRLRIDPFGQQPDRLATPGRPRCLYRLRSHSPRIFLAKQRRTKTCTCFPGPSPPDNVRCGKISSAFPSRDPKTNR